VEHYLCPPYQAELIASNTLNRIGVLLDIAHLHSELLDLFTQPGNLQLCRFSLYAETVEPRNAGARKQQPGYPNDGEGQQTNRKSALQQRAAFAIRR